nr:MAG TPA: hypothetical protein [Caudoviricetes sp.]
MLMIFSPRFCALWERYFQYEWLCCCCENLYLNN